ncbi:Gnk2-homologous domain, partial [Arabidopsis suecica]
MSLSSSVTKHLISASILAIVAMQLPSVHSVLSLNETNAYLHHICINGEGTFKSGSPYEKEIKQLIDFLSSFIKDYSFVHGVSGIGPDDINVKFQCRGDTLQAKCRSCLATAFSEIRSKCPNNKGRIIWYDNCHLDLSSIYTYGQIDYKNNFYMYNAKDVSGDKKSFYKNMKAFLHKLKAKASSKENKPYVKDYMYAAGRESLGTVKLYAMVQCTQDLSLKNCTVCLDWIMTKLPECCNGKQGGRVLSPSCNFSQSLCALSEPIVHGLQLTKQLQINNFMGIIQETRSLRKNGIMIPSPRSASICYVLSKLNALSTTTLACNLKHQITITLARFHVKALLRVDFLVPARSQTLIPSLTPLCLLTAAICSSIDSFLEELSMTFDLTCTKKLVSFRLKALKDLLCFYLIYPSFYLMLALGNGFISCIVNIRIS